MSMSQRKGKSVKMSEKTFNAELNKAYTDGYKTGYDAGLSDGIRKRYTINQLRAVYGLPPIPDGLKADLTTIDE